MFDMAVGRHGKQRQAGVTYAKERILASKDRNDFEGMVILPARFSELSKVGSS